MSLGRWAHVAAAAGQGAKAKLQGQGWDSARLLMLLRLFSTLVAPAIFLAVRLEDNNVIAASIPCQKAARCADCPSEQCLWSLA